MRMSKKMAFSYLYTSIYGMVFAGEIVLNMTGMELGEFWSVPLRAARLAMVQELWQALLAGRQG